MAMFLCRLITMRMERLTSLQTIELELVYLAIKRSTDTDLQFGVTDDVPVVADYDGMEKPTSEYSDRPQVERKGDPTIDCRLAGAPLK